MARFDPRTWSRETRLLIITVVLSLAVLLTLARFRFPVRERLELPARPLERLTERSPLDDTSAIVQRVRDRVESSLIPVRLEADAVPRSVSLDSLIAHPPNQAARFALALRIATNRAVMLGAGRPAAAGLVRNTRAQDRLLGLTVIDVEEDAAWTPLPVEPVVPANFMIVAEAADGLVVLRPAYGGADGFVENTLWNTALTPVAISVCPTCSAFAFTLNGALVGGIVRMNGTPVVLPAAALMQAAGRLASGDASSSTLGVHLQELDAALERATGVSEGVVIAGSDPGGPASAVLQPGDVLIAVDGRPVTTPEQALAEIARLVPGRPVKLQLQRGADRLELDATPQPLDATPSAVPKADAGTTQAAPDPGLTLQRASQGVLVTTVAPGSLAQRAGLRGGDVITTVNGRAGVEVQRIADMLRSGVRGPLLLGIVRGGSPLVLAWPQADTR